MEGDLFLVGAVQFRKVGHYVNIFTPGGPLNVNFRFTKIVFSCTFFVKFNVLYEVVLGVFLFWT